MESRSLAVRSAIIIAMHLAIAHKRVALVVTAVPVVKVVPVVTQTSN